MSLTESIVEDAALEWFGELGYVPCEAAAERDLFTEVVLVARLRRALRRVNPATFGCRTLAILRDTLLPKLLSVDGKQPAGAAGSFKTPVKKP